MPETKRMWAALRSHAGDLVLVTLLIAATVQIVLLKREVRRLNAAVSTQQTLETDAAEGDNLRDLLTRLGPAHASRPYLLLYLSPLCSSCSESMPAWRDVVSRIGPANTIVLGAVPRGGSVADVQKYLRDQQLSYAHLIPITGAEVGTFRLHSVPRTIIVDPSSVVRHVWRNELDPAVVAKAWKLYEQ